jgi:hypothetical protein
MLLQQPAVNTVTCHVQRPVQCTMPFISTVLQQRHIADKQQALLYNEETVSVV